MSSSLTPLSQLTTLYNCGEGGWFRVSSSATVLNHIGPHSCQASDQHAMSEQNREVYLIQGSMSILNTFSFFTSQHSLHKIVFPFFLFSNPWSSPLGCIFCVGYSKNCFDLFLVYFLTLELFKLVKTLITL